METILHLAGIEAIPIRHDYLLMKVRLANRGTGRVGPGSLVARQTTMDGSVHLVEFFNVVDLFPGDETKVSELLRGSIKEVEFRLYRTTDRVSIHLSGTARRGLSQWSLTTAA